MSKWKKQRKMGGEGFGGLTFLHNINPCSFGEVKIVLDEGS